MSGERMSGDGTVTKEYISDQLDLVILEAAQGDDIDAQMRYLTSSSGAMQMVNTRLAELIRVQMPSSWTAEQICETLPYPLSVAERRALRDFVSRAVKPTIGPASSGLRVPYWLNGAIIDILVVQMQSEGVGQ